MAKDRIGKFERWILLNTYLKTIEQKLPEKWDLPRWMDDYEHETYWKHLFKSEVLRNFFKLEYSEKKLTDFLKNTPADYFKGCGYWGDFARQVDSQRSEARRNRALATYSRTKNTLVKKGFIKTKPGKGPNAEGIQLTAKGKKKAKKFYSN
jgi:hypothetical protein